MSAYLEYKNKLELIFDADQKSIKDFKNGKMTKNELVIINSQNTEIVRQIISKIGFPRIELTSDKAYKAAVLTVLHSGDSKLLAESIASLGSLGNEKTYLNDLAYMTDKLCVINGKSQIYGTQYKIDNNNNIIFYEIENINELEDRRRNKGLSTLNEYKKMIEKYL